MSQAVVRLNRETWFRRLVSAGQSLGAKWHQFWFDPADPLILSVIRVLTGWMLLYNLLTWSLDLNAFFSRNGLQPLDTVRRLHGSRWIFSFWMWIDDASMWTVHWVSTAIVALFFLGVATRVTSVLAFLITISYSQRVPVANFGFDQILGMLCLYLSLGPSGACLSIDSLIRTWWKRRRGLPGESCLERSASARMSMRLIQLHLCAIYFWAGFAKLKGPSWWTGEAMWRVIANQEYQTMDLTWMSRVPWLPYLIAHITIIWEVYFIVLVWNHRLRPAVLVMGVLMHVGIGAFLGMWTFGLIMAFAYLAFSDPERWRAHLSRRRDTALTIKSSAETHQILSVKKICMVAASADDRASMRNYLRHHRFDCRAVSQLTDAAEMLRREPVALVLIHGPGFSVAEVLQATEDLQDLSGVPVVVSLTDRQLQQWTDCGRGAGVTCVALPASLHDIRVRLEERLEREPVLHASE